MGLSKDEQNLLKRLQRKADEPDAPPASRSLNISIDLGDEKQVERAHKLGLLGSIIGDDNGRDADDDDDAADDDDDRDADEAPRRRSYFRGDE